MLVKMMEYHKSDSLCLVRSFQLLRSGHGLLVR